MGGGYGWLGPGLGLWVLVIVLAVALVIVVLGPHVAVLKPIAEKLGLATTQVVYVPVNHTVYVNYTKYIYVNKTVPIYINRTVYANPFHINHTCHLYVYVFQRNMSVIAYRYTDVNLSMY